MKKAFFYGVLSSFFFAFTFLLNRSMNLSGGYWMWSASLRYLFMLPMLAMLLWIRPTRPVSQASPAGTSESIRIRGSAASRPHGAPAGASEPIPVHGSAVPRPQDTAGAAASQRGRAGSRADHFTPVFADIKKKPLPWLLWSTVGFGLFYLPLTLASVYGESWLIAASWEFTIVAGVLLTPLFGRRIPPKNLLMSLVILAGIFLLQIPNLTGGGAAGSALALLPLLIAAFSYPLGNRKMMQICPPEIDAVQRVFGMTLCSLPFWLIVSAVALIRAGLPGRGQILQSLGVALFSGVIATILFFHATDLVKSNVKQLAAIEATQCGEVLFTLLGGILLLKDPVPEPLGMLGIAVIAAGMVINSLLSGD